MLANEDRDNILSSTYMIPYESDYPNQIDRSIKKHKQTNMRIENDNDKDRYMKDSTDKEIIHFHRQEPNKKIHFNSANCELACSNPPTIELARSIEKKHRNLLENLIPTILRPYYLQPTLFVNIIHNVYQTINEYMDDKIKEMISNLGVLLGIEDKREALLDIILYYPNSLDKLDNVQIEELVRLIEHGVNESLSRDTKLTKVVKVRLQECFRHTIVYDIHKIVIEVYEVLYLLKFKISHYTFVIPSPNKSTFTFKSSKDGDMIVPLNNDNHTSNCIDYMYVLPSITMDIKDVNDTTFINTYRISPYYIQIYVQNTHDTDVWDSPHKGNDDRSQRVSRNPSTANPGKHSIYDNPNKNHIREDKVRQMESQKSRYREHQIVDRKIQPVNDNLNYDNSSQSIIRDKQAHKKVLKEADDLITSSSVTIEYPGSYSNKQLDRDRIEPTDSYTSNNVHENSSEIFYRNTSNSKPHNKLLDTGTFRIREESPIERKAVNFLEEERRKKSSKDIYKGSRGGFDGSDNRNYKTPKGEAVDYVNYKKYSPNHVVEQRAGNKENNREGTNPYIKKPVDYKNVSIEKRNDTSATKKYHNQSNLNDWVSTKKKPDQTPSPSRKSYKHLKENRSEVVRQYHHY